MPVSARCALLRGVAATCLNAPPMADSRRPLTAQTPVAHNTRDALAMHMTSMVHSARMAAALARAMWRTPKLREFASVPNDARCALLRQAAAMCLNARRSNGRLTAPTDGAESSVALSKRVAHVALSTRRAAPVAAALPHAMRSTPHYEHTFLRQQAPGADCLGKWWPCA